MALTVENGTGLANADSYISEADADTYIAAHGADATWTAATTAVKEAGLRIATQYLDAVYGREWLGAHINSTMSLDWPRLNVETAEGYYVLATAVPQGVKDATCEVAKHHVGGTVLFPVDAAGTNLSAESVKIGPIEVSSTYSGEKADTPSFPLVEYLLSELITGSGVYRS